MDKLINTIFEEHFSDVREIKWVNFDMFSEEWKGEIRSLIECAIEKHWDDINIEALVCPVSSSHFDIGAGDGPERDGEYTYKVPKLLAFEYRLKNLGCDVDKSILNQMTKLPRKLTDKKLKQEYDQLKNKVE